MEKTYPLIIVFYLDREMMKNRAIVGPFAESVNTILATKNSNAIAFFLPTDGEERVECINPLIVSEPDMVKITQMIEDIKTSFSVGEKEITTDEKPCKCESGDKCDCENNL